MDSNDLCKAILHGSSDLNVSRDKIIIETTVSSIERSMRFSNIFSGRISQK